VKSNLFTTFATCQLFLDFCDQIERHEDSTMHVQRSNAPCESSRIQIRWKNGKNIRFLSVGDCYTANLKLNQWRHIPTRVQWVMSYVLLKERSVPKTNLSQRRPSCRIDACIQLHNCLHRPHAHRWDIWNCLWYVMEIEENELDNESWGSWAIFTKNWSEDLHATNCWPKAQEFW